MAKKRSSSPSPTPGEASPAAARSTTLKRSPRRKGNNKVPIEVTLEREADAWELHKQGYSQAEIARMLTAAAPKHPIGQQAVSKALRRVQDTLEHDLTDKIGRYKVSQVGRLEGIFLLSMKEYRASAPRDPRWFDRALEAMRDQRKILGIDAPLKFDGTVKTDRPLEDLSDDELLAEHAALQSRLKQVKRKRKES